MVCAAAAPLLIRALLALWVSLLALNYLLSPDHVFRLDSLIHFIYPRHGKFSLEIFGQTWLARGWAIAVWAAINAAVISAGLGARRFMRVRAGLPLAFLLGLAPAALLVLGLGLCGLLAKPALLLGGIILVLAGGRPPKAGGRPAAFWWGLAPCLLALPAVLAPEAAFDSLRYHQGLPRLYLAEHRIFHVSRFLFAGFPANLGMLYALGQAFASPLAAKLLNWQFLPLSAALLWQALRPVLCPAHAGLVCAGFCAMPFLALLSASANADCGLMCLLFAATISVLLALRDGRLAHFRTAGWLLGTALGVKYLGAFAAFAIAAGLWWARPSRTRGGSRRPVFSFLRLAVPGMLFLPASWAAKNWLFTGNPVFPYLQVLFGAFDVDPETLTRHLAYAANWRNEHGFLTGWLGLFPVSLSRGIYAGHAEAFSPLLFFLPAALATARGKLMPHERFLTVLCLVLYVFWSHLGGGIYRFLVPLFPAGMLICGLLLPRLGISRLALTAGLLISLLLQLPLLLSSQYYSANAAELISGRESEHHYLRRTLPPHGRHIPALARAAHCLRDEGPRARLLPAGEIQAFYSPVRAVTDFEFALPLLHLLAFESESPKRIRIRLRQRGIAAILYRVEGMITIQRMSSLELPSGAGRRLQEFWQRYAKPVWIEEHTGENCYYHCYLLRRRPGDFSPPGGVLWFNLPGMEHLTRDIDLLLEAGETEAAAVAADRLAEEHPWLAAARLRQALAARARGDEPGVRRARALLKTLGYEALLE